MLPARRTSCSCTRSRRKRWERLLAPLASARPPARSYNRGVCRRNTCPWRSGSLCRTWRRRRSRLSVNSTPSSPAKDMAAIFSTAAANLITCCFVTGTLRRPAARPWKIPTCFAAGQDWEMKFKFCRSTKSWRKSGCRKSIMSSESSPQVFTDISVDPFVRGLLHRPATPNGNGLVLAHGAGSNCQAPVLVALAETFADAGFTVLRCDLPYRQDRSFGPPGPGDAKRDRAGLKNAAIALSNVVRGRIFLGGHSYGGRQASMLCAELFSEKAV